VAGQARIHFGQIKLVIRAGINELNVSKTSPIVLTQKPLSPAQQLWLWLQLAAVQPAGWCTFFIEGRTYSLDRHKIDNLAVTVAEHSAAPVIRHPRLNPFLNNHTRLVESYGLCLDHHHNRVDC